MEEHPTTILVRRAKAGDPDGLAALVERLAPLLLSQARYRLGARFPGVEPEDLVQDVWLRALPRLAELGERGGRETPVLLRFLATTLLHRVQELLRGKIRSHRERSSPPPAGQDTRPEHSGLGGLADDTIGVVSRAVRGERDDALQTLLGDLADDERELLVLRGIEQQENRAVAERLGETPNAVSLRYNRLLQRLRERLSGSVLDEL